MDPPKAANGISGGGGSGGDDDDAPWPSISFDLGGSAGLSTSGAFVSGSAAPVIDQFGVVSLEGESPEGSPTAASRQMQSLSLGGAGPGAALGTAGA